MFATSCSNSSDRLQEKVVRLVSNSSDIVAFGKIDVNTIIEKGELKEIPKFGVVLSNYLGQLENSIQMDSPVYFTADGPFDSKGNPARINLFLDVANSDSLRASILRQGFDMDEKNSLFYFSEDDVTVVLKEDIALVSIAPENNLTIGSIEKTFKRMNNATSNEHVTEILNQDGDVVSGVHLMNLYGTANTSLNRNERISKDISALVKNSYVGLSVFFEDGELRIVGKNYFSEKLASMMFLNGMESNDQNIQELIGGGNAKVGLSLNLNLSKLQNWISSVDPEAYGDIKQGISFFLASISPEIASKDPNEILTGQIAAILVGESEQLEGLTDFNVFIGMREKSVTILKKNKDIIRAFVPNATISDKGVSLLTNTRGELVLPDYASDFGTNGIDLFLDVEKLNLNDMDIRDAENYIRLIKSVSLKATNDETELIVRLKKDQNVLKQVKDQALKDLQDRIRFL